MHNRTTLVAAVVATVVVTVVVGVPIGIYLLSHPPPPGTWLMVLLPNAILLAGAWIVTFQFARTVLRRR